MKLSEIKGEKAIEVFADLLEPASKILTDEEIATAIRNDEAKVSIIQKMLKKHSKEVIEIMAILDEVPFEEYKKNVNFVSLPKKLIELFNDEAISDLFSLQSQNEASMSFGSATESTEEKEN